MKLSRCNVHPVHFLVRLATSRYLFLGASEPHETHNDVIDEFDNIRSAENWSLKRWEVHPGPLVSTNELRSGFTQQPQHDPSMAIYHDLASLPAFHGP